MSQYNSQKIYQADFNRYTNEQSLIGGPIPGAALVRTPETSPGAADWGYLRTPETSPGAMDWGYIYVYAP